jgi:nicotinamidase-related amidase
VTDAGSIDDWADETRTFYAGRGIGDRVGYGTSPAIVVVDMSRAFTDPSYRVGSDQTETVAAIARVLAAARARADVPVFFTTMAYEGGGIDAGTWGRKVPALLDLRVDDAAAMQIDERIAPVEHVLVFNKKFASAFFGTPLAPLLAARGVDTVILMGCSTSGCIRASAVDAVSYGYRLIVPEECVADRAPGPHHANLFDIQAKYGDVVGISEVLDYLQTGTATEVSE